MKIKIIFTKQVLLTALLVICSQFEIFSQVKNIQRVKKPGLFFGFSGGLAQTYIINEGNLSVAGIYNKEMNSYFGSAEIGYFFTRHFGLSTGVDYIPYKTQVNLDTYQNKFDTKDSENETYERRVTGTDIKEIQEIGFVNIPLYLNLRLPIGKIFSFFFQAGANLSVPVSKNYSSNGNFTYKGYYSAYNVLVENLPQYGFPSNHNTFTNGEIELQQYNINGIASAGIGFNVLKKFQIVFTTTYSQSLSKISAYDSPDNFQLSSDVDQMNSLIGGSKVSLESMGVKFSLRYYFKSQY